MELERRIALFTSALVLGLLVCICVTVSGTIARSEKQRLARDLMATRTLFGQVQGQRFTALESETRLLADLPQLKAVMGTHDAPTIVDAADGFRALIHADSLEAFDETDRPYSQKNRAALTPLVRKAAETGQSQHGFVADGDQLRQAVAVPVRNGDRSLGVLVAGYGFGSEVLASLQKMTRGEFAVVTGQGADARLLYGTPEVAPRLGDKLELAAVVAALDGGGETASLPHEYIGAQVALTGLGGERVGRLIALRPLSEGLATANRLRWNVVVLSSIFCFIALVLSFVFARSISRPLRALAARLATADAADADTLERLTQGTEALGADRDVQSVLASFGQLVTALAAERRRHDEGQAQRTQALEGEVTALASQNTKLAEVNRKLLDLIRRAA